MKAMRIVAIFLGILSFGLWLANHTIEEAVHSRVDQMLHGMLAGGVGTSGDIQEAICFWYNGTRFISDRNELMSASDQFDEWRRVRDLYRKIESYEIAEISATSKILPEEFIVTVRIDGKAYAMLVKKRETIKWYMF